MRRLVILLLVCSATLFADIVKTQLRPLKISQTKNQLFVRSLYSHQFKATETDTVLFVEKTYGISIVQVDSVDIHELLISFFVDSQFVDFDNYELVVMDAHNDVKAQLDMNVIYNQVPRIESIELRDSFGSRPDTLCLKPSGKTIATMLLRGSGLYNNSKVIFDDPAIKVINEPGWRVCNAPHELQVGIEIAAQDVVVGSKSFRLKNEYAIESFDQIFIIGARSPQFIGRIPSFVADGSIQTVQLKGAHFSRGIDVKLIPPEGLVYTKYISSNEIQADINLPVLEQTRSYRLALVNPDGKADTTGSFTVRNVPLSLAKMYPLDQKKIYLGKKVHTLVKVDTRNGYRLSPHKTYDIQIAGNSFPVIRVVNDSTCEAPIKIYKETAQGFFHQHVFTVNESGLPPRWRGMVQSYPAPEITYVSQNRIIHPSDTLLLVIKGKNLKDAGIVIDDPEVIFDVQERRDDLLRVRALAGEDVSPGSYALQVRVDGVPFNFSEHRIEVMPWQPFQQFMQFNVTSLGDLPRIKTFQRDESKHYIKQTDALSIKINLANIKEEYGTQKVSIRGVLFDSLHNIKAEAFDNKILILEKENDVMLWRWRVSEKIKSGDRIEITVKNPGGHNKATEVFIVERHWSESFHGSSSFIVVKMPFGADQETGVLNNMGIGISYQPFPQSKFIEFDGSFIIGKNAEDAIDVGLGGSAILWQHLQIGLGTNLTGKTFKNWYMFLGTRFKIALPF